jgi:hypothetical protein
MSNNKIFATDNTDKEDFASKVEFNSFRVIRVIRVVRGYVFLRCIKERSTKHTK